MRRAALVALALVACADDPGPLDAETVLALARSRGDARGSTHTGPWFGELDIGECDCPIAMDPATGFPLDFCYLLGPSLTATVTEADGIIQLPYPLNAEESLELIGPIWRDGRVSLGAVNTLSTLLFETHAILRLEGTIVDNGPPWDAARPQSELEAEIASRFSGQLGDQHVQCDATFELRATMPLQFPPD